MIHDFYCRDKKKVLAATRMLTYGGNRDAYEVCAAAARATNTRFKNVQYSKASNTLRVEFFNTTYPDWTWHFVDTYVSGSSDYDLVARMTRLIEVGIHDDRFQDYMHNPDPNTIPYMHISLVDLS